MILGVGHVVATIDTHIATFLCENPLCEVWGFVFLLMGLVGLLIDFVALLMGFLVFLMMKQT
jgi:hypothetical protein